MNQLVQERPKVAVKEYSEHYQLAGLRVVSTFPVTNLATTMCDASSSTDPQADCYIELHKTLSAAAISEAERLADSLRKHDPENESARKGESALVNATWLRVYQLPTGWLVRVSETVDFLWEPVTARLTVHPHKGSRHREVEHFLVATMLPLICTLNGKLVLHASSIERAGRVVLFVGASGSGKSTAAYIASLHGWRVFADDFVVLENRSEADTSLGFVVHSGGREVRLRQDIIEKYSLETVSAERAGKFAVSTVTTDSEATDFSNDQVSSGSLAAVFFLRGPGDSNVVGECEQPSMTASTAFRLLLGQVFFSFVLKPEQTASIFATLSSMVSQTVHRSVNAQEEELLQALVQH